MAAQPSAREAAEVLERSRQEANNQIPPGSQQRIHFFRQGEPAGQTSKRPPSKLLTPGAEWKMEVDLVSQLQFPQEICSTTLNPDVVLWSAAVKSAVLIELTVPWEEGLEAAYERKKAKYADLVEEGRESGWSMRSYPVEVGARGFVGSSTARLLKDLGLQGARPSKSIKELSARAEEGSHRLWLRRHDKAWGVTSE